MWAIVGSFSTFLQLGHLPISGNGGGSRRRRPPLAPLKGASKGAGVAGGGDPKTMVDRQTVFWVGAAPTGQKLLESCLTKVNACCSLPLTVVCSLVTTEFDRGETTIAGESSDARYVQDVYD